MIEIDIWRTAHEMMTLYGDDAEFKAGLRADKLLELGDAEGFQMWKRVTAAIVDLTRRPTGEETVH